MLWLGIVPLALVHLVALLAIPLGLPGTWLQVAAAAAVVWLSDGAWMGWTSVAVFTLLAGAGEAIEALTGAWGARRFGGSRVAAWGALVGGVVGAIVGGIPVPIVGSVIASFVGTFAGAMAAELWQRRTLRPDLRVGLGALVGRVIGVTTKLALGFTIAILSLAIVATRVLDGA